MIKRLRILTFLTAMSEMRIKTPFTIILHLAFWMVLGLVPILLVPAMKHDHSPQINDQGAIHLALVISTFYFNAYFLYPVFFRKGKVKRYVLLCVVSAIGFTTCFSIVQNIFTVGKPLALLIVVKLFISLGSIGFSTFFRLMIDTTKQQRQDQQREHDRLQSELTFLRSQVSPHFMFNVLNSLVALIRQRSNELERVVLELSNLMRYMLYESDHEKVSIRTEVEYLISYVNIQLLRFRDDVQIAMTIQPDLPERSIEPMLIIPLVENAFKHGIGMIDRPEIRISIASSDHELTALVANRYDARNNFSSTAARSGIGLDNLRKRLGLLYADRFNLDVTKSTDWFTVSLKLRMKDEMPGH